MIERNNKLLPASVNLQRGDQIVDSSVVPGPSFAVETKPVYGRDLNSTDMLYWDQIKSCLKFLLRSIL